MSSRDQRRAAKRREKRKAEKLETVERTGPSTEAEWPTMSAEDVAANLRAFDAEIRKGASERFG